MWWRTQAAQGLKSVRRAELTGLTQVKHIKVITGGKLQAGRAWRRDRTTRGQGTNRSKHLKTNKSSQTQWPSRSCSSYSGSAQTQKPWGTLRNRQSGFALFLHFYFQMGDVRRFRLTFTSFCSQARPQWLTNRPRWMWAHVSSLLHLQVSTWFSFIFAITQHYICMRAAAPNHLCVSIKMTPPLSRRITRPLVPPQCGKNSIRPRSRYYLPLVSGRQRAPGSRSLTVRACGSSFRRSIRLSCWTRWNANVAR